VGTFGDVWTERRDGGRVLARVWYRDDDGKRRLMSATGTSAAAAKRRLKTKMTHVERRLSSSEEITADSPFTDLVDYWLADLDAEGELADSTRERYEWEVKHLVLPEFEHFTLREITVGRVDRYLKKQRQFSYSRASHSKKCLSLVMGLALRLEAIDRNPVVGTKRLKRPPRAPMAIDSLELDVIRKAVASWRRGEGYNGPKPDGQLEAIIEVMVGTSARIGEALAIRVQDVNLDARPPTVRIAGTIVSPKGKPTYRQDNPKSRKAIRTVAVPSVTADALRARLEKTGPLPPDHLVFFSRNGTPLTTANVRRRLRDALKDAGVEVVTPHAFRRTVATVIDREAGLDLAAELLGHTSSAITKLHYIEPDENVDPRTALILEALAPGAADRLASSNGSDEPPERTGDDVA
jgi:integrase